MMERVREMFYHRSQAAVQKRLFAVASFSALRFENRIFLCCDPRTPWEKASLLLPLLKGLTDGNCLPASGR